MSPTAALITLQTATTVRSIKGSGIETTVVIFRTATFIKSLRSTDIVGVKWIEITINDYHKDNDDDDVDDDVDDP